MAAKIIWTIIMDQQFSGKKIFSGPKKYFLRTFFFKLVGSNNFWPTVFKPKTSFVTFLFWTDSFWSWKSYSQIWLLWVTANMWKLKFPKLHVAGAYLINLFSLTWYNFSSPLSRTFILRGQLIFSVVQLFFSEGQLMYLENKSFTSVKKSCTMEK